MTLSGSGRWREDVGVLASGVRWLFETLSLVTEVVGRPDTCVRTWVAETTSEIVTIETVMTPATTGESLP
ncbi:hypothetical protein C9J85_01835 [Haloferax sp. wsp5]|nr:hypothetical protein C9J85_01835 [Haloferax sp. wsp5]